MPGIMTTKSGKHMVFDVTEYLPGHRVPNEFEKEADGGNKPFFFQPTDYEVDFGGTFIAAYRGYPLVYSPGYATPEEAVAAAEEWEATKEKRDSMFNQAVKMIEDAVTF